jgi:hypothetical protein
MSNAGDGDITLHFVATAAPGTTVNEYMNTSWPSYFKFNTYAPTVNAVQTTEYNPTVSSDEVITHCGG